MNEIDNIQKPAFVAENKKSWYNKRQSRVIYGHPFTNIRRVSTHDFIPTPICGGAPHGDRPIAIYLIHLSRPNTTYAPSPTPLYP